MTLEDCFGLLFLEYFALVISVSVGVFARGATGWAIVIVAALSGPLVALLMLAIAAAAEELRRTD